MNLKINPLDPNNHMTFKDAAIVSTIASASVWILTFLANTSIGQVRADLSAFVFDCVKTYLTTWAGNFVTLSGLSHLLKPSEAKSNE
jgi:hypothetical protein